MDKDRNRGIGRASEAAQADVKASVCALVPYPPDTTPSQRFRTEQWMPYLREQGIRVDLLPFVDEELMELLHQPGQRAAKFAAGAAAFGRRVREVLSAARYDAILVHRGVCIAGPAVLERLLAWRGVPVIFDFDDAIFRLHTTKANRWFGWLKFPGKTATICRLSSHVVVGNAYLAEYARQYNSRVTIVPTSIDTDHFVPQERNGWNGRIIVGWTGSSTSQTHLEMFEPVLRELLQRREVEIRVVSNREPALHDLPHTWRPWTPETEVEEIGRFDIGIMPMPDDEWSRGKCALKALQYMSMSIPTICSAVGANCEVVRHGENGLLATTAENWIASLLSLVDNAELRMKLGAGGRRTVEAHFSTQRCAELFADVVRETVSRSRRHASSPHNLQGDT